MRTLVTIELSQLAEWLRFPECPALTGDSVTVASPDDASLAFYASDGSVPDELYVSSFDATPRRLTNALHASIRREDLVVPTVVRFKSYDGVEVTGVLYRPHQASADAKAPAIVKVHGGPGGQAQVGYNALTQALVNRGYVVFDINNRAAPATVRRSSRWTTAWPGWHSSALSVDCALGVAVHHAGGRARPNQVGDHGSVVLCSFARGSARDS